MPELQELRPGDFVPEGPGAGWTVTTVEPGRLLLTTHGPMRPAILTSPDEYLADPGSPSETFSRTAIDGTTTALAQSTCDSQLRTGTFGDRFPAAETC